MGYFCDLNPRMRSLIEKRPAIFFILIAIVSIALHWNVFPLDLIGIHNMRQAQTQQNIQNFYRHDFNILNPRVNVMDKGEPSPLYRYEFPVMQWSVALVYKFTGESFLVTRIMMFLIGMVAVIGMYFLLKYLFGDPLAAMAGAWAFNFSPAFYFYTLCPMPDNLALCSAILSLAFLFRHIKTGAYTDAAFAAFFLSLGTASKLPFILFGMAPAFFILKNLLKNTNRENLKRSFIFIGIYCGFMLPTLAWYAWVVPTWHNGVVAGVFDNQITWAEVKHILSRNLRVTFPERLTNWANVPLLVAAFFFMYKNKVWQKPNFGIVAALSLTVLAYWAYEFNMIGTVHDYYLMPFLPLIFIGVGYSLKCFLKLAHWIKWPFLALLLTLPSMAFNYTKRDWTIKKSYYNIDAFIYKDELRAAVPDTALCIILNDPTRYVFSYLIDKRGLILEKDGLKASWMEGLIKDRGIQYLYSNSRKTDENPDFAPYLDSMVLERGGIRVFKLKAP